MRKSQAADSDAEVGKIKSTSFASLCGLESCLNKGRALEGKIHQADVMDLLPLLSNLSVDLSIIDPPYFGVSDEEWDNQWSSLADYLAWTKTWVAEVARVTRYSGSVYLYGCTKNLLTLAAVGAQFSEAGFEFREESVVDKGIKSVSGRTSRHHKHWPMVTENILYLVKDAKPFVRDLLMTKREERGLSAKQINEAMGFGSNGGGNWTKYAGDTRWPLLPTEEHWNKLRQLLDIDVMYREIGVTFNTEWGITNVWRDVDFYAEERIHSAQKPKKLAKRMVSVNSNDGDLVLDLFSGSGNVSKVCASMSRRFVGIDAAPQLN